MDKYKDILESVIAELTETPNDKLFSGTVKFKWGRSDEWNKNKRFYPSLVADSAIEAFNKESQKGAGIVGQLDHPMGTAGTLLASASHLITKVWKDDKKVWWADAKIMNTSRGKDLLAVLKTGATIGASLRGFGDVDKDGKVKAGLKINAIDFVSSPSFGASATVDKSNVFESFVPEDEDEGWNEESLEQLTEVMDGFSNGTIALIVEKLEKTENIKMTPERVKGLILWIKCSKDNPNIAPFHKWFVEQQEKFGATDSNFKEELNEGLRKQANFRNEERMAGTSQSANTMFLSRRQIEQRQKEIDQALEGSRHDAKTISRLYAEYILAGGKLSRVEYIKEFGF